MEVVGMISYDESKNKEESFGGFGGFFSEGMRWANYIDRVKDEYKEYPEAIRRYIVKHGIKQGGDWHQTADDGVPLFDDDTVATFSYRAWGDLLAAIWSEEENEDYHYMDFYMGVCMR